MATRNTGPVKPPVLDLEARSNKAEKAAGPAAEKRAGADKADTAASETPKAKQTPRASSNILLPLSAGIGGAILGVAIAYGIAVIGFWPQLPQAPSATPSDLARLETDIGAINSALSDQSDQLSTQADELSNLGTTADQIDQLAAAFDTKISDLNTQITTLSAQPQIELPDLSPLQTQIDALETKIGAIAAGASADDATQISADLVVLRDTLNALEQRLSSTAEVTQQNQRELAAIQQMITSRAADTQSNNTTTTNAPEQLQLSLALSGIDAALHTGKSYAAELLILTQAIPDIDVPQIITSAANIGLPVPSDIAIEFGQAIPEILSAKPTNQDANWSEALVNRAQALLALRPTGATGDNSPEALIAGIEISLAREDFGTAHQNMNALPEAMRLAAGDLPTAIETLAQAQEFVASARTLALAPLTKTSGDDS